MSEIPKKENKPRHRGTENLIPAKKGEVRNPAGRKTAGASVKEWMNSFSHRLYDEPKLRRISKDVGAPWAQRAAAIRMLRALECPDLADFEDILSGEKKLSDVRKDGTPTDCIKKVKSKERYIQQGEGEPIKEVEREIELHDRSGSELDRIMDRTEGKPMQPVAGPDGGGIPVDIVVKVIKGVSTDDL